MVVATTALQGHSLRLNGQAQRCSQPCLASYPGPSKASLLQARPSAGHLRDAACAAAARGGRGSYDYEDVHFDDEEDWEDQGSRLSPSAGPLLQQAFRAVGVVSDRLTELALSVAPDNASPAVVKTAVNGGIVLLVLSFAKGILSFFLTIGTVLFGAFVAVRVFGLDVGGGSFNQGGGRGSSKPRGRSDPSSRRDPRARQSEWKGLLGGGGRGSDGDDGILDVWFDRKGGSKQKGSRKR